ncbi:MAG: chemotaxis protein CheW [Phormidesmis sp.]
MQLIDDVTELTPLSLTSTQADPLGLVPLPIDNRQRFLRFTLSQKENALIPLDQILEVMQLALENIFPVPDMPSCILGVCSWQGETLWLVDLNHLVGYVPLSQQAQTASAPIVIVVQSFDSTLGLVVEQVGDVDLIDEASIRKELGLCSPSLEPFVLGYCPHQGGTVLSVPAIVQSPLWQFHHPLRH